MTVTTFDAGVLDRDLIACALAFLRESASLYPQEQPLLAYSGGKDGLVASLLAQEAIGADVGICETSFYVPAQLADIRSTADRLGFRVTYKSILQPEHFRRYPRHLFPHRDVNAFSQFCEMRQRRSFEGFARARERRFIITGRKKRGNSVKSELYRKGDLVMVHPLREWTDPDIWAYLKHRGVAVPWVYQTPLGQAEGNSPWNLYRRYADKRLCWRAIHETDAGVVRDAAANGIAGAREFLQ